MKRGTPRHPKVAHLRQILKVGLATAVGYLELLWHFAAEFAPRGDVGRYDDLRIEAALDWHGKPGRLVSALIESGWIDRHSECRLCVHDWADHADDAVRKRLSRLGQQFVVVTPKVTGRYPDIVRESADNVRQNPVMSRLPEPEPEPVPEPEPSAAPEPPPPAAELKRGIRALATKTGSNGHVDRTDAEDRLKRWEWMRSTLMEYPEARDLPGKPDDKVVQSCLDLGDWDTHRIANALSLMHFSHKKPSTSWMWFPTVLRQYLEGAA